MLFSIAAPRSGRHLAAVLCGAALALPGGGSCAEEIRVSSGACGEPVRLIAREAPLSSVLKRLGESLGFELVYQSQRDPLVSRNVRSSPVELVRDVARGMNFSVEQLADRSCANGNRVLKVAVLPDRVGEARVAKPTAPDARAIEIERIARQTTLDYLRSHGMEDQTIESLQVR